MLKLNASRTFFDMICNTNSEEYVNSFLSQQPLVSYYAMEKADPDDHIPRRAKERYNFKYGSWEFEPLNISADENETVIYLLKEKYVFNEEAEEKFQNFYMEIEKKASKMKYFDGLDYDGPDSRFVCFTKKRSDLMKFLTSNNGQFLFIFLRILGLDGVYEKIFFKQADKFIEISVEKRYHYVKQSMKIVM